MFLGGHLGTHIHYTHLLKRMCQQLLRDENHYNIMLIKIMQISIRTFIMKFHPLK